MSKPPYKRVDRSRPPLSVVFSPRLEEELRSEGKRRGLKVAPTIRSLVMERLEELKEERQLTQAQRWQRARMWALWDRIQAGEGGEVSESEIEEEFDSALNEMARRHYG